MPPTAPPNPPMPTTEPTARLGNRSEAMVNRLADQPWCDAVASPTSATATQKFFALAAKRIGKTVSAQVSIAVLRAAFTLQPRFSSRADSQPPAMLPAIDIVYTITSGQPSAVRLKPYRVFRNFGSQYRKNHHTGSVRNFAIANAQVWR